MGDNIPCGALPLHGPLCIIIAIFVASFIDKIALYFGLPLVIVLCIIFLAYSFIIYPYKHDKEKFLFGYKKYVKNGMHDMIYRKRILFKFSLPLILIEFIIVYKYCTLKDILAVLLFYWVLCTIGSCFIGGIYAFEWLKEYKQNLKRIISNLKR